MKDVTIRKALTFVKMRDKLHVRDEIFDLLYNSRFAGQARITVPHLDQVFSLPHGNGNARHFIAVGCRILELLANTGEDEFFPHRGLNASRYSIDLFKTQSESKILTV